MVKIYILNMSLEITYLSLVLHNKHFSPGSNESILSGVKYKVIISTTHYRNDIQYGISLVSTLLSLQCVIMGAMASQTTGVFIVCSRVCSGADQRKYQSSASLAFVRGIHRWPVDSPHKGPVTQKMFPFDDIMCAQILPKLFQPLHPPHWSNRFEILHREQENNWAMGKKLMATRDFARFEFKMSFKVIPYIAITTWGWHASIAWCETAVAPMCRPKQWSYCSLAL